MANTIKNKEENLEVYRQQRIKDFLWIMKNLEEVSNALPSEMTKILKEKLEKELFKFLHERKKYENTI